jgi:hypothetical protein
MKVRKNGHRWSGGLFSIESDRRIVGQIVALTHRKRGVGSSKLKTERR